MYVAVKYYSSIDVSEKPFGIPDHWPAQVIELGNSMIPPDGSGLWQVIDHETFAAYKDVYQPDYDAWYTAYAASQVAQTTWTAILNKRIAWGSYVITDFRVYVINKYYPPHVTVPVYSNLQIAGALQQVQSLLTTGLLAEASAALSTVTTLPIILDDWYDDSNTQTVRQRYQQLSTDGL